MASLPAGMPDLDPRIVLRVPADPFVRVDTCDYSLDPRRRGDRQGVGKAEGWALACLSPEIDLTTANGRMLAGILSSLAEWELELISERTTSALAAAKAGGTRLGPAEKNRIRPEISRRILALRRDGMSYRATAALPTEEGVPTALSKRSGGRRAAETVRQAHLAAL